MIAILDYGAGNLRSVEQGFARVGVPTVIATEPAQLREASGLVLPGVGAFAEAMAALRAGDLLPELLRQVENGKPLLGICLGMQALFDSSEEGTGVQGLGLIGGQVRLLPSVTPTGRQKVPHMGWNTVSPRPDSPLFAGLPEEPYLYFVHSYACFPDDPADIAATATYGVEFAAAVQRGHIMGMQFHPEKSGTAGKRLLQNFAKLVEGGDR
ncbi:MAG: imidazole glycerol phosphate synthase subunit HisH [Clostridia bacterium]|nr:imidazole glycerol phosphate synthase subunit HisH [Clostridia bacterium]